MIWNRKFNYPASTRSVINGSRHYSVAQQQLPSVTSILSLTKSEEDKAALSAWKKRVGEKEAQNIEEIKDDKKRNNTSPPCKINIFLFYQKLFCSIIYKLNMEE